MYACICMYVCICGYMYMYMSFKIYIKSKMTLFSEYISVLTKSSSVLLNKDKAKNYIGIN